jgi:penicillin-binding protein 2
MFERRLKAFLILPIICGLVLVGRLYQLQIVQGDEYTRLADAALISPKQFLPPLRGRILDRFGRVLVSDEPAYDVTVHYGVLSMNEGYLLRLAAPLRKKSPRWQAATGDELEAEVKRRIAKMWTTIHEVSGQSIRQLRERRDAVCRTVDRLRQHIAAARQRAGLDQPSERIRLKEEDLFHAVLRDITPKQRTRIELELSNLPFVRVEPSVRRVWTEDAEPLCHVLGGLGQVTADMIRNDPDADDWLACYRAGDEVGVSGVERLGEEMLRGKRGYEERCLDGTLNNHQAPIDGRDVALTIDFDLQRQIADLLVAAVREHPPATGASCVVIDVQTREVLALVSVPTYGATALQQDFTALRDDAIHMPLLFRAVQAEYQPGSIVKPVTLLAGFANKLVTPTETVFCTGQLIPGVDKWHCWTHWRGISGHGAMNAEDAIKHSCNVFFYTMGQRIGADRLTTFSRSAWRGQIDENEPQQGTGLIEERDGLIPTLTWMKEQRHRGFRQADGRNYAIGQGELGITPLLAANLFATLADGRYRAPTIIANDCRQRPASEILGVSPEAWALVRRGLYRCVNEDGGTAFKYARLDGLEICGKTGSAECVPRVIEQRFTFETDEGAGIKQSSIIAPTVEAACEMLDLPYGTACVKAEPLKRYPGLVDDNGEGGKVPTHAWFAGYAPYRDPRIALAIIIEYGGGGGHSAGPVARAIFETLMRCPQDYLGLRKTRLAAGGAP